MTWLHQCSEYGQWLSDFPVYGQLANCFMRVLCLLCIRNAVSSALSLRLYNVADNNLVIKAITSW